MKTIVAFLSAFTLFSILLLPAFGDECVEIKTPLKEKTLKEELSFIRGPAASNGKYPRTITYLQEFLDYKKDNLKQEEKTFTFKNKPKRIIPHAVGVAEILWAICPREKLIAFNELAADPEFSFLAPEIKKQGPLFNSRQTELVLGLKPDLVFTVFYSDPAFKESLKKARIPVFDLGYFGTIESIKKQILLIGSVIGEEANAQALVSLMDAKLQELRSKLPKVPRPLRILYYGNSGYVPGKFSNFNSLCEMLGVINVGTEQGVKSLKQIDFETLLKWNPDIIIVPQESRLKEQFQANKVLASARAVKNGSIYYMPDSHLAGESQFMILSANLLAGIVYQDDF